MYYLDTLAEARTFIDESFRKALAQTFGDKESSSAMDSEIKTPKTAKTKKNTESSAKQLRREEVSAKVLAAKEMCHNIFAASSLAAVVEPTVAAQTSPATSCTVTEYSAPQSFSELLSGSLEAANYGYMPTYSNLPVRTILCLS